MTADRLTDGRTWWSLETAAPIRTDVFIRYNFQSFSFFLHFFLLRWNVDFANWCENTFLPTQAITNKRGCAGYPDIFNVNSKLMLSFVRLARLESGWSGYGQYLSKRYYGSIHLCAWCLSMKVRIPLPKTFNFGVNFNSWATLIQILVILRLVYHNFET